MISLIVGSFFSFTSQAESIASQFLFFLLIVWPCLDRRQWCAKNICIFSYLETPNRSSPYVFAERSSPYFFCWNLLSSIYWQMPSIHRNETILIRNNNPSKWDHFNLKLFKFLGELTECKLRCTIQFKTFFYSQWNNFIAFFSHFFSKAKVPKLKFFNCDST